MKIELIRDNGEPWGNWTVYPRGTEEYERQQNSTFEYTKQNCGWHCWHTGNAWMGGMVLSDLRG